MIKSERKALAVIEHILTLCPIYPIYTPLQFNIHPDLLYIYIYTNTDIFYCIVPFLTTFSLLYKTAKKMDDDWTEMKTGLQDLTNLKSNYG